MSNDKTYNGWTNYETWVVKLWMDNERGSYDHWRAQAVDAWEAATANGIITRSDRARFDLADLLKAEHEDNTLEVRGVYADLLRAALSEVNWYEIADALLNDMQENAEPSEDTEAYEGQDA
jgi:hypothetical protein